MEKGLNGTQIEIFAYLEYNKINIFHQILTWLVIFQQIFSTNYGFRVEFDWSKKLVQEVALVNLLWLYYCVLNVNVYFEPLKNLLRVQYTI